LSLNLDKHVNTNKRGKPIELRTDPVLIQPDGKAVSRYRCSNQWVCW